MEAKTVTSESLMLEIEKNDGSTVAEFEFPVEISEIEDMFRHINFREDEDGAGGAGIRTGEPYNKPDNTCNEDWFVLVHGYNVNGEQSRGWSSEFFKRLHHSGSNAKFYSVSWHGDESQIVAVGITPNYQANVNNAFGTADELASLLTGLANTGGGVTVAAHSLGNMVVGSAIHDWGARPNNYYMIDAAVPHYTTKIIRSAQVIHS